MTIIYNYNYMYNNANCIIPGAYYLVLLFTK